MRRGTALPAALVALALAPLGLAASAGRASGDTPAPNASGSAKPVASAAAAAPAPKSTTVLLHAPPAMSSVALGKTLPDPTALVSKDQWVYDLRYSAGDLYLLGIHHVELAAPQATPRAMGRFAFELFEGATLLERARFDFPMLGDEAALAPRAPAPDAGTTLPIQGRPVSLTAKVSSRVGVMFPAAAKGTRLDIVDRATDRRWPLPWPPTELTASAVGSDSTTSDAGSGEGG